MCVVRSSSPARMEWGPVQLLVVEAALVEAAHSKGSVQLLVVGAAYARYRRRHPQEVVVPTRHCLHLLQQRHRCQFLWRYPLKQPPLPPAQSHPQLVGLEVMTPRL